MPGTALAVRLSATATAVLFATTAAAAENQVAPVTVTATRTAQTADEAVSSVSVITREDIERTQASSLPELLGRVQGVEFSQSGGRGKQSSLFLRGTDSDQFITLIDGVRAGSATAGTTAFETLPLENIERIEVVRGPRSSLYGADAIGGVIQIFTRETEGPRAGVAAGSHDYRRGSAGYGASGERGGFSIDLSAEDSDGFDACDNDPSDFVCGVEPDDDGFESANLSLRGRRDLGPSLELSGNLLIADTETEFDGTFVNETEQRQTSASVELDWTATQRWQSRLTLGRSTDDSDNLLDGDEQSNFDTTRFDLGWQNDISIGHGQILTAGIDFLRDEVDSSADFAVDDRETVGAFIQHQWTIGRWDTQASLRRDFFDEGFDDPRADGDEFDDETTGSLGLGYRITDTVRLFGSYGTAFRAPTFNDLFFPGFGNPDLDPEESETFEIGVRGSGSAISWEVTTYRTEIDDLIALDSTFTPQNIDEARIDGLEAGVDVVLDGWRASLNGSLKDAEDDATGNDLPRRAEETLRASVTRTVGAWTLGADFNYQGERFDDAANATELDSYTVVDLRTAWRFAPDWRASFKINNATDEDYRLTALNERDDRNFIAQVEWRPGARR